MTMTDHLTQRAQRLIEEFEEGANIAEGLANVLFHLAAAWHDYSDDTTLVGVRSAILEDLASELTAPTLLDRALAGDPEASRQVLQQMGVIDANGQLTEKYRPYEAKE